MLLLRVILLIATTTTFSGLVVATTTTVTFPGLQSLLDIFDAENATHILKTEMTPEELGPSLGHSNHSFIDFVSHRDRSQCVPEDRYIQHLFPHMLPEGRTPLYVNCIHPDPRLEGSNNTLLIMEKVQDFLELLQPHGNATKRTEPGRCVFVYFYLPTCLFSVGMSLHVNALPHLFPHLQFGAIDVNKFPQFTTEFGIVGVPAFMLFHQGKPILKYMHKGTFPEFVTRHTRIKSLTAYDPKTPVVGPFVYSLEPESNWVLYLAWSFIIICAGYYFGNSIMCQCIMEMIKQNWRESSEQMAQ